jgi:glutamate/tyrosine decarboxylase-like PLP-dependent enzyme
MDKGYEPVQEENLDPDDWESMKNLGHRMVDDMIEYLKSVGEQPVWRHAPEHVKKHFHSSVPQDPQSPEEIYEEFRRYVLPYPIGNIHPRFWGWVIGTGTLFGAYAEFLASAMNTNTGGVDYHSANYVEKQVIDWFKDVLCFPQTASGLLTSGCSAANLIGLAVGRNAKAGPGLRKRGLHGERERLVVYASEEAHSSVQKAIELLGLGSESLHHVPVNDSFQIDVKSLEKSIVEHRRSGLKPACVVGTAGTTNTGAFDNLAALADICQAHDLWFHVDGAFGAWAALADQSRGLVQGMERADSLAFDLHKWMYMPYEIACVLIAHEETHRDTFSLTPDYLSHGEGNRGMTGGDLPWFSDYGFQLSRGFRALKAWMSIKEHGMRKYGRLIQQNIEQASYLAQQIEKTEGLELMAPVPLNVVCFRYIRDGVDEVTLDALNRQIIVELQERGIAAPSGTNLRGRSVIHVAITNHRSRWEDFDVLLSETLRIGHELASAHA